MKKYRKILLLSAAVLMAAQGTMVAAQNHTQGITPKSVVHQKQALPKVGVTLKALPTKYTGQPFKDISHSIFKNYINAIYKIGITTGYTKTTYAPNKNVNRGEMAIFLYRMAGSPSYNPPFNVFTDIKGLTNQKQILWLSASGITSGTGTHYDPHGNVTRGQMAAFLHRMAVKAGKAPASGKYNPYYADAKKHMFANDIGWLRSQGITDTPKSFNPDASMTRGEMAAFLHRFYNKFNKQSQPVVNKTSLQVKDSTLYVNDAWQAKDNFVSATDKNGKAVAFNQVKVSGQVNTKNAGKYKITYSYGGKTATATVTVKARTAITLGKKIISVYVGDTYGEAELRDNITGLTNKDGQDVLATDKNKVQITAKDAQHQNVVLAALTQKAGTYTITYSYAGKTATLTLAVAPSAPVLSADGQEVQFMNQSWSVLRGPAELGEGNYLVGAQKAFKDVRFNNGNYFFETNERNQDGYLTSNVKAELDTWYDDHVKGTAFERYVQPVVLPNPTLGDMIDLGILKSNTEDATSSNWYLTHNAKYRTCVDESHGVKQAFAMSSADVSSGKRTQGNEWTTDLTSEALAWQGKMKANGTDFIWLRSPGPLYYNGAHVNSGYGRVNGNGGVTDAGLVPVLVVHVE